MCAGYTYTQRNNLIDIQSLMCQKKTKQIAGHNPVLNNRGGGGSQIRPGT